MAPIEDGQDVDSIIEQFSQPTSRARATFESELRLRMRIIAALKFGNAHLLRHFGAKFDNTLPSPLQSHVSVPDIVVVNPNGGEIIFYGVPDSQVARVFKNPQLADRTDRRVPEIELATVYEDENVGQNVENPVDNQWRQRYMDLNTVLVNGFCEVYRQTRSLMEVLKEPTGVKKHDGTAATDVSDSGDEAALFRRAFRAFGVAADVVSKATTVACTAINTPPITSLHTGAKNPGSSSQWRWQTQPMGTPGYTRIAPGRSSGFDQSHLGKRRRTVPASDRERLELQQMNPSLGAKDSSAAHTFYDDEEDEDSARGAKRRSSDTTADEISRSRRLASRFGAFLQDSSSDDTPIWSEDIERVVYSSNKTSENRKRCCTISRQVAAPPPPPPQPSFDQPTSGPPANTQSASRPDGSSSDGSSGASLRRGVERLTMDSDEYMADVEGSLALDPRVCGERVSMDTDQDMTDPKDSLVTPPGNCDKRTVYRSEDVDEGYARDGPEGIRWRFVYPSV